MTASTFVHYVSLFAYDQLNMTVLICSIALAVFVLGLARFGGFNLKEKMILIYFHISLLIFPFVFILFNKACQEQILMCQGLKTYAFGIPSIMIGILLFVMALSYTLVPLFYQNNKKSMKINSTKSAASIRELASKLGWKKPEVYALDTGKPVAFAFSQVKPSIFVSVGMMDILSKKELEAVMLHELWHTHTQSASYKVSAFISRFMSPFAAFSEFEKTMTAEEIDADAFAIKYQSTKKYINSAKEKISLF
ncbi:MAG: hypothetical protein EPN86_05445 [Nanoarchaeota archaeon]|nr:MAG: hypothetical protein EPN86_05445 [Nanoarchaeota archaeon]